jgi:centrosomal protein CEP41
MAFAPRSKKKPLSILEKKIPVNPRYAKIGSVIDTGAKVKEEIVLSDKVIARRRGELFSRINSDGLAKLLLADADQESVYTGFNIESPTISVVHLEDVPPSNIAPKNLILDIRSEEDYLKCHITGAVHYPLPRIVRDDISINLYMMRRKEQGKHLVVYSLDDKSSVPAGISLAQKGWEEVLVLSGGLEEFASKHPHLVTGVPPALPTNKAAITRPSSYASSLASARSSRIGL